MNENNLGQGKVYGEATDIIPAIIPIQNNPNEKQYLILFHYISNEEDAEEDRHWTIMTCRQDTYDRLRDLVTCEVIDPIKSLILAEDTRMRDAGSVIGFLESMLDNNMVEDNTGFDPYEYDEEEERGSKE